MQGMTTAHPPLDRSLSLRERKKLRTRRALADAALRLFTEKGFDATTLEELADEAEVSKSTFFRFFPAKEAAAIEAETELWTAYLAALGDRDLSGPVLGELHQTLAAAAAGLDPGWDERFVAICRLIATEPALLAYVEHYRSGVERQATECLASKLGLDPEDLRLQVLAGLATTAFSVSGRHWVRHGGQGGRQALLDRLDDAVRAIPASLDLSARLGRRSGAGDDLLQGGGMSGEGAAPVRAQLQMGAPAAAGAGLAHGHVAGLFQDGDLLGQRRVAQAQAVPHEGEVGPVGRGQQGDDREPGRRVDQLVEPRPGAHQPAARAVGAGGASSRRAVICCAAGRPAAYAAAISRPASVLGSGAPAAPSAIRAST